MCLRGLRVRRTRTERCFPVRWESPAVHGFEFRHSKFDVQNQRNAAKNRSRVSGGSLRQIQMTERIMKIFCDASFRDGIAFGAFVEEGCNIVQSIPLSGKYQSHLMEIELMVNIIDRIKHRPLTIYHDVQNIQSVLKSRSERPSQKLKHFLNGGEIELIYMTKGMRDDRYHQCHRKALGRVKHRWPMSARKNPSVSINRPHRKYPLCQIATIGECLD